MNKISKGTIIRVICLLLALVNITLETFGKRIIPISDEQVAEVISVVFTIVTSLTAAWKNNSFTEEAIKADEYLKELREGAENDGD